MVIIKDVHWVPDARDPCLLSVGALCERGCKFMMDKQGVYWTLPLGQILPHGNLHSRAYIMSCEIEEIPSISVVGRSINDWHRALAHASTDTIREAERSGAIEDLIIKGNPSDKLACEPCIIGKSHRLSFSNLHQSAEHVLDVVITDLGYSDTASFSGAMWIVVFIDEYSRYTGVSFYKRRIKLPMHTALGKLQQNA